MVTSCKSIYKRYGHLKPTLLGEMGKNDKKLLFEKCPYTELFLVRIFLYLDGIRRFTPLISVFSPNIDNHEPEVTPYLDTFHAVNYLSWPDLCEITFINYSMEVTYHWTTPRIWSLIIYCLFIWVNAFQNLWK